MLTPLGLELLDLEVSRSLLHCCDSGELRNLEIKRLDRVKNVTSVYKLVIDNLHIGDIARYLGRDARNLCTHAPIPRPGGRYVVLPGQKGDQDREERDCKRGKTLTERDEENWSAAALPGRNRRRSRRSLWLVSTGVWDNT